MLSVMACHWQKGRQRAASSFPPELHTSEQIITILAKVILLELDYHHYLAADLMSMLFDRSAGSLFHCAMLENCLNTCRVRKYFY